MLMLKKRYTPLDGTMVIRGLDRHEATILWTHSGRRFGDGRSDNSPLVTGLSAANADSSFPPSLT